MMDWTPTNPNPQPGDLLKDTYVPLLERESWLKPATFHAPEQPTGLEELLQNTTLAPPSAAIIGNGRTRPKSVRLRPRQRVVWSGLGAASISVLVGLALYFRRTFGISGF